MPGGSEDIRRAKAEGARTDPRESQIIELVRQFESCRLPVASFTHGAHLTVALFYLTRMPVGAATQQFRLAIKRFIAHYGETGYNETITMFWISRMVRFLMKSEAARPLGDLLDALLENYDDSRLIYSYYSRDRLQSDEAKTGWVSPDIKPFDF